KIAGYPFSLSAKGVHRGPFPHKAIPKRDAVERGQRTISDLIEPREAYPGPIVGPRRFETPHPSFASVTQSREVHVNDAVLLKAAHGPEPFVGIGRVPEPGARSRASAGESDGILEIIRSLNHAGVSGLKKTRRGARFRIEIV